MVTQDTIQLPGTPSQDQPLSAALLDAALRYASLGLRVLPLVPGRKGASLRDWPNTASSDEAVIRGWWEEIPLANVGLLTGQVFEVIDPDNDDAVKTVHKLTEGLHPIAVVKTPRGEHVYLPALGRKSTTTLGGLAGIDYKGDRSYVVAPPSYIPPDAIEGHPGGTYRWVDGHGLQAGPDGLLLPVSQADTNAWRKWLNSLDQQQVASRTFAPNPVSPRAEGATTPYGKKALDNEWTIMALAPKGQRNDQLNRSSFAMGQLVRGGEVDEGEAVDALTDAALRSGLSAGEIQGTLKSGMSKGKTQPRSAPSPRDMPRQRPTPQPTTPVVAPASKELAVVVEPASAAIEPIETPQEDPYYDFWQSRPSLSILHQWAWARMVSPWALLGCVIARVLAQIPEFVALPPVVGHCASLNSIVALIGPSGAGKGAARGAATDAVMFTGNVIKVVEVSQVTGEGISAVYAHVAGKDEDGGPGLVWDTHSAIFYAMEGESIVKQAQRQGSVIMPTMRSAWSGEELGGAIKDRANRIMLPGHGYRYCGVYGFQYPSAQVMLNDANGGTPQRFLWMAATDSSLPDIPPETPPPLVVDLPKWEDVLSTDPDSHLFVVAIPAELEALLRTTRAETARGERNPLDGHLYLAQEKVAVALAVLDGNYSVSMDDWNLAGTVMRESNRQRDMVQAYSNRQKVERRKHAAIDKADSAEITNQRTVATVAVRVLKRLQEKGPMSGANIRRVLSAPQRQYVDAALIELIDNGEITEQNVEGNGTPGKLYSVNTRGQLAA